MIDLAKANMIIFGGFIDGVRTNEIAEYNVINNYWTERPYPKDASAPCPRSGHSAVFYQGRMVIFGGKTEGAEKLNDLWQYDVNEGLWTELIPEDCEIPLPRSGHTAAIFGDFMIVFGGMYEVTKELNDLHVYNF